MGTARTTGDAAPDLSRAPLGLWVALTLLVWGLFAPDSGLYQDDATQLSVAQEAWTGSGLAGLVAPAGTPTRRLLNVVFLLPWLTGESAWALQALTGLLWLGTGWAAWRLARALFPDDTRAAWLAGTLTVCATSDALSVSPVAAGYQASVFVGLMALVSVLRFLEGASGWTLALGCAAAAASVFVIDGASVALAMAPLLFVAARGLDRRALAASAAFGLALAPYAVIFRAVRRDPDSYLRTATFGLGYADRALRTLRLAGRDLSPWEWPRIEPMFGASPPPLVPTWIWAAGALVAAALVLGALRRVPGTPSSRPRDLLLAGWCAAAALATHAAWAGVALSSEFYRTHVMTRVLVSIVLGLVASRLLGGRRPARLTALGLVAVFTACGVAGGLARQDHFLSTWRRHRRELRSLVDAVPRARPATTLLLRVPHEPAYTAMKVPYLAFRWSTLLWPDPSTRPRVFLWSVDAGSACVAGSEGFRCRLAEEKAATTLPWDAIVLLTWRPEEGRFRLEEVIPEDLSGGRPSAGLYRPRDLVGTGPPHPRAARLLRDDVALARLLP